MSAEPVEKRADDHDASPTLTLLSDEVSTLRSASSLPKGVDCLSDPTPARYVSTFEEDDDTEGRALAPNTDPAGGQWHVHARIRGNDGSGYDTSGSDYLVRFTFDSNYPHAPPDVHVLSKVHHLLVDEEREVAGIFFHSDNLPPTAV